MKVVIVGGGFGGVKAALELQKTKGVELTLISASSSFDYHAALYRSATGWSPREVVLPLRDMIDESAEVVQDEILSINPKNKTLTGTTGNVYNYDQAIISVGQNINYYSINGMADNSHSMDNIAHTIELRLHLREQALSGNEELNFVIIGGGASGVELAAGLESFINELVRKYEQKRPKVQVILIEGSNRLLPALAPKVSKIVERRLKQLGVEVRLNTLVKGASFDEVVLEHETIKTHSVIWTAGFSNNSFFSHHEGIFTIAKNGKVIVDEFMLAHPDVYVIGDNADTQYSGMAQTALHDATFVASNIKRQIKGQKPDMYVPKRPIYAVPVGKGYAVLQWGSLILWGFPAWIMRRLADFRLFNEFEPLGKAIKAWRAGETRARWMEVD